MSINFFRISLMLSCFCSAVLLSLGGESSQSFQENFSAEAEETEEFTPAEEVSFLVEQLYARFSYRLVVDLSERQVSFYELDKLKDTYPVAVGQDGWETPTGVFKVQHMHPKPAWRQPITGEIIPPGPDNPLGERWIGFWSDEKNHHHIGFHGSNQEELVGQAVSHGCLRMRNRDIKKLYKQISEGTIVIVQE